MRFEGPQVRYPVQPPRQEADWQPEKTLIKKSGYIYKLAIYNKILFI